MAFSSMLQPPSSPTLCLTRKPPKLDLKLNLKLWVTVRCSESASVPPRAFDLRTYWMTLITEINQKLDEAMPVQYPQQIYEAMRYSVLAQSPERVKAVMCVMATELFGSHRLAAFPTACALEIVPAASFVQGDLPFVDGDPFRKGRLSSHTGHGVDMAILAGTALFSLGFRQIVSQTPSDLVPAPRLLRVVAEIARSVGSTGMAAGQFPHLGGRNKMVEFGEAKKFGEMAACSAVCGGLLAGAEDDEVQRLRRYGRAVGVLYQVVDDILEEKMKSEARDRDAKKKKGKSYARLYGIEKALEFAEDLRTKAKKELDGFEKHGDRTAPLYSFVDHAADRGFTLGASR